MNRFKYVDIVYKLKLYNNNNNNKTMRHITCISNMYNKIKLIWFINTKLELTIRPTYEVNKTVNKIIDSIYDKFI